MQTRQLVVIPPNQTFESRRITTMSTERYQDMLDQSLVEPSHWVNGIEAIVDKSEWARYGYKEGFNGNPVLDPEVAKSIGSVARADFEKKETQKKKLSDAKDDATVGSLEAKVASMESMIMDMMSKQADREEKIKAEAIAQYKDAKADLDLAQKPKTTKPKKET